MQLFDPNLLGPLFGLSEFALLIGKRAGKGTRSADQGSLRVFWTVIPICVLAAIAAANWLPQAQAGWLARMVDLGGVLFLLGLSLRWYAILYLGRFFTVNVAIAADHRVIDTGPYRFVRHPSYSGALLQFLGLGITFGNWVSLLVLLLPAWWLFQHRIAIEERALVQGLGDAYLRYMTHTRRLIPGIY
ncbi:MAG TPA: isoprenylcysteine carboxylmethyltransferase family protein [Rhodanobacter sp.]